MTTDPGRGDSETKLTKPTSDPEPYTENTTVLILRTHLRVVSESPEIKEWTFYTHFYKWDMTFSYSPHFRLCVVVGRSWGLGRGWG